MGTDDPGTVRYRLDRLERELGALRDDFDEHMLASTGKMASVEQRLISIEGRQIETAEREKELRSDLVSFRAEMGKALKGVNARLMTFAFSIALSAVGVAATVIIATR